MEINVGTNANKYEFVSPNFFPHFLKKLPRVKCTLQKCYSIDSIGGWSHIALKIRLQITIRSFWQLKLQQQNLTTQFTQIVGKTWLKQIVFFNGIISNWRWLTMYFNSGGFLWLSCSIMHLLLNNKAKTICFLN